LTRMTRRETEGRGGRDGRGEGRVGQQLRVALQGWIPAVPCSRVALQGWIPAVHCSHLDRTRSSHASEGPHPPARSPLCVERGGRPRRPGGPVRGSREPARRSRSSRTPAPVQDWWFPHALPEKDLAFPDGSLQSGPGRYPPRIPATTPGRGRQGLGDGSRSRGWSKRQE
jgi:hypothetical protein